jgi:superfamily II DNA/RNA helicase
MSENLVLNNTVESLDLTSLGMPVELGLDASTTQPHESLEQVATPHSVLNPEQEHKKKSKPVEAVANPVSEFEALGLARELNQAVFDLGYTKPTTVQLRAIPLAMQDTAESGFNDLMVSSQTGSGKTAAFLLPVLNTLLAQQKAEFAQEDKDWNAKVAEALAKGEPQPKRPKRKNPLDARNFKPAVPGALVLCPTRELAQQVAQDAIGLVKHCKGLRVATVVGGMPYAMQISKLQNANLVVATPGRLIDLQNSKQIQLSKVQFLVIDEADRMLDLGFADDLAQINELTRERRQTMMFSATFAPRIQQLASRIMRSPQRVQVDSPQDRHNNIKQVLFWADSMSHKRKLLDHWLRDTTIAQAIVFASTQIECDSLAQDLQQSGFSSVALHGALSQSIRNRRLNALRDGQVQILVATDVAARGIDVPSISHVFNYGLPMKAEDYVHRIGRTGRAGRDGIAVTFAEFRDRRKISDIEHFTQQPLRSEIIPGLEPQPRSNKSAAPARRGRSDSRDFRGSRDSRDSRETRGSERSFGQPAAKPPGVWRSDAKKPFEGASGAPGKRHSGGQGGGFAGRGNSFAGSGGGDRPAHKPRSPR